VGEVKERSKANLEKMFAAKKEAGEARKEAAAAAEAMATLSFRQLVPSRISLRSSWSEVGLRARVGVRSRCAAPPP